MRTTTTCALAVCLALLAGPTGTAGAQAPMTAPATGPSPGVTVPPGTAPAPNVTSSQPLPTVPPPDLRLQIVRPLVGVWRGERELEDGQPREFTELEFREDGTLLVTFWTDAQQKMGRKPVVSRYRYAVNGVQAGVYTLEFEYTGGDREVAAENRRRVTRLAIAGTGRLRTDEGEILTRMR